MGTPNKSEIISFRKDYNSQFEILVSYLYHHVVKSGSFVIDGGANSGLHAMPLSRLVSPDGMLFCFEPLPHISETLRKNIAPAISSVCARVYQNALGDKSAKVQFICNSANPALSRIMTDFDKLGESDNIIEVDVVVLDHILRGHKIDFIKLDLEGADFLALKGGENILRNWKPPVVFENSRAWAAKKYNYTAEDFFIFFENLEYEIYDLHNIKLTRDNWEDQNLSFEFIAFHKSDPRGDLFMRIIEYFWSTINQRSELLDWIECVKLCRDPFASLPRL